MNWQSRKVDDVKFIMSAPTDLNSFDPNNFQVKVTTWIESCLFFYKASVKDRRIREVSGTRSL